MIFRRLAALGYEWEDPVPRIYAIDFGHDSDEPADLAEQIEEDRRRTDLRECLEAAHRETLEIATDRPPPAPVAASRRVYGNFPRGWPPWD